MTPVDKQISDLKGKHPRAVLTEQPSGALLVEIPQYKLPVGWNKQYVTIIFIAPTGYPGAQPDCFWAEPDDKQPVRLANGGTPNAANETNPIPGIGPRGTWFSWHVQQWNPNRDTLLTFLEVIEKRFLQLT